MYLLMEMVTVAAHLVAVTKMMQEVKIMKKIARAAEASYGMHGSKACCSKIGCAAWMPIAPIVPVV